MLYFEDLSPEDREAYIRTYRAQVDALNDLPFPVDAVFGTGEYAEPCKVLGPVVRFEPYRSDWFKHWNKRETERQQARDMMCERPNGEQFITFAWNLGLMPRPMPRRPGPNPIELALRRFEEQARRK